MVQPHWLRERQQYVIDQERYRHDDALHAYGEYAMFALMWRRIDLDNGLVGPCLRCVVPYGGIGDVYQQAGESKCPECFGTAYEGGFKALLVRPSVWDYTEQADSNVTRGALVTQTASVQTTSDFRLRTGDFIFRVDGSRFQVRTMSSNHLRTGFSPSQNDAVGYNFGQVAREDLSSVAYMIPPTNEVLEAALEAASESRTPVDWSAFEIVRAPVL